MVIDGFCIAMATRELVEHLELRAKHYDAEADRLGTLVRAQLEGRGRDESDDVVDVDDVQRVRDRAAEFRFLATHLVADATYQLDMADTEYLELIKRTSFLGPRRARLRRIRA